MRKYGLDWWRMVIYWRLHLCSDFIMGPVAHAVYWADFKVVRPLTGWFLLSRTYDRWSMRFTISVYSRWADLCYGPSEKKGKRE